MNKNSGLIAFPYQAPRQRSENLWELQGEWRNKFGRRMTVIRLKNGELLVHNAFRLSDKDQEWLKSLGQVTYIIAPNVFHCSDAAWLANLYPQAKLYVPQPKLRHFQKAGLKPLDVNRDFPQSLANEIQCIPMQGLRWLHEAVFYHVPSQTLILCDLAFNMPNCYKGLEKIVMDWNRVGGRFGPSKITRLFLAKDKKALLDSYRALLDLDIQRIIVNHGLVLEQNCQRLLRRGIEEIFGPL